MRLALIGFGNIATTLLGLMGEAGLRLDRLTVLVLPDQVEDARRRLAECSNLADAVEVVTGTAELLAAQQGLVVECAGHGAVASHVPMVLRAGIPVVLVSIGALADAALEAELRQAARDGKARLILPAGAVGGIDLLAALGSAGNLSVRYRGTKPPHAWRGTPAEELLDLPQLSEARSFFSGTAREAARDYPKNANVAATLALAGAGFDATEVELVADPRARGNIHDYHVTSPLARYSIRIENEASAANAKTSVTTVYSVLREIRNYIGPVAI